MIDNPFEVSGRYRNRRGAYEVLALEDDQMTILYDNGRVQTLGIRVQARIWENIQIDEASQKSKAAKVDKDRVYRQQQTGEVLFHLRLCGTRVQLKEACNVVGLSTL